MPESKAITLNFKPVQQPTTQARFTYKITPNTISIVDTKPWPAEAVLRKIEY